MQYGIFAYNYVPNLSCRRPGARTIAPAGSSIRLSYVSHRFGLETTIHPSELKRICRVGNPIKNLVKLSKKQNKKILGMSDRFGFAVRQVVDMATAAE